MLLKKYRKAIFFFILAALILPEITLYFHEPAPGKDLHGRSVVVMLSDLGSFINFRS